MPWITTIKNGKPPIVVIILLSLAHTANAAEVLEVRATAGPEAAPERYMAGGQENTVREGVIESRLTHITIETRLVGRAELVIEERPVGEDLSLGNERPLISADATWDNEDRRR